MKRLILNYSFNPTLKTITFDESFRQEQITLITNITSGDIIYLFSDPDLLGSLSERELTLAKDTSSMSPSDKLQIFVDDIEHCIDSERYALEEQHTMDTNMQRVFGSMPISENGQLKVKATTSNIREIKGPLVGLNSEISIDCEGAQTIALQTSGVWAGTITFEARGNNGDYLSIYGLPVNGITYAGTSTSNGLWHFNVAGLRRFRVRYSTYTSGTVIVDMIATSALSRLMVMSADYGSQAQPLTQRATSYELTTYDTNLAAATRLDVGLASVEFPTAPTINPGQPTTYPDNKFAKYPQTKQRLRVESGGDKRLPIAQEQYTNRTLVSYPELYSMIEQVRYELQLLNQNFSVANGLSLPVGTVEIK